jgi:glycosyltransferase involved in cell wall biosynthesis
MNAAGRIFVAAPRFPTGTEAGGAETLLKELAVHAAAAGRDVRFYTTCARDHFTWRNALPEGRRDIDGLPVHFFRVDDDRDEGLFLKLQSRISRGRAMSREQESAWIRNSVNSRALCEALAAELNDADRVVAGPYLFGLTVFAARVRPRQTLLVPCLHDEPFARTSPVRDLFAAVRGCLFNSRPERDLAAALFGHRHANAPVVGMGIEAFDAHPERFLAAHGIRDPFLLYAGRREPLKGTPMLVDYFDAFRRRTGRPLRLVLMGSGPVTVPEHLAPHVTDLGFVSETVKHDAMAAALAFCHPSVNESLGIVLLEAWQAGTPALVHAGSAVLADQCRRSGGGLWFRHYPDFETMLLELMDQPGLRARLGESGQAFVTGNYAWPAVTHRFLDAVDAL